MRKLAVLSIMVIFSFGIVAAQGFNFGVKGGLNFSKLKFDEIKSLNAGGHNYSLQCDDAFVGFHLGLQTRINLFNAFIQPELVFNTSGGKVLVSELSGGATFKDVKSIKYNKIDLPILVGIKLGPIRVGAGPVASAILSSSSELDDIIPDLKTVSKGATIGYQLGAGVDLFKHLTIDYRYEGGLSKWGDELTVGGNNYAFDSRSNMHLISLGVMF